jgi:hypothetical protein
LLSSSPNGAVVRAPRGMKISAAELEGLIAILKRDLRGSPDSPA